MTILGITLGHDSSFALVRDGEVAGVIEAERYFRQKRYKLACDSLTPGKVKNGYQFTDVRDLEALLKIAVKKWGFQYDYIAVQNQGRTAEFDNLKILLEKVGVRFKQAFNVDHHLSHAAAVFYTSQFKESVILSYDGAGNDGYTVVFKADGSSGIEYLHKSDIRFGQCYNNVGFIVNLNPEVSGSTAGKLMGLTAYGRYREDWAPFCREYIRKYKKRPNPT